ncbi:hypothetical protein ACIPPJ_07725 [Streptomyces sp. NPDC086091]|uniref:hypothetical protein n=1 Tax=Streptomyces sp. NPDC086091 TaxID=3365751 RepID=UPI003805D973
MRLDWPEFRLECDEEGHLVFVWKRYSLVKSHIEHCTRVQLLPQGPDGLAQWHFHLRFPHGPTPGLLVVRVDVPADRLEEAEEYTELLRRRHGVPDHPDDGTEDTGLHRIPPESPDWIVAPAGAASEELFGTVMARVDGDGA